MQISTTMQMHNSSAKVQPRSLVRRLVAVRTQLSAALDQLCLHEQTIQQAAALLTDTLSAGGRILIGGNGGSAAEAQHFATELVGRFKQERAPYSVISLTADTAILTAISNDYGFEHVFERQVRAYGRSGDVFVAFSTSGESENLVL